MGHYRRLCAKGTNRTVLETVIQYLLPKDAPEAPALNSLYLDERAYLVNILSRFPPPALVIRSCRFRLG